MEALREITEWKDVAKSPNHIYLMDGSKAVAYIKWGTGSPEYFSKPMTIDKRGRKFVRADIKLFKAQPKSNLIEIKGSKGDSYFVDPDAKTCTCAGFQFRGQCKHLVKAGA